ncbi:glutaredoxin-like protein DUF836 [Tamilnaduibacter salinus]|uniref:Glutaredoxin-like protein DUF836 n=1 Tax=Tamilnaduibacter salinus TaxID=1484056 RepID=A0A2A2I4Q8_9GAMM|nr:glutaredoxin family protein [Tamilnaduibacter salinus]PAV26647.1 thioredoxin family protein [Tamilnaduibacter salinus]PVY75486.1 glutaredoxin-like protein DUF836 [Tamilnaduibacter salinus]
MADPQFLFYTTTHCHLCELAENLMMQTPMDPPVPVDAVDIAQDARLVETYGERIPVLRRLDTDEELDWPFTQEQLLQFIGR